MVNVSGIEVPRDAHVREYYGGIGRRSVLVLQDKMGTAGLFEFQRVLCVGDGCAACTRIANCSAAHESGLVHGRGQAGRERGGDSSS